MPRPEFAFHLLNETGKVKAQRIAEKFTEFLNYLEAECTTQGREMAVVRTKLEEACFFAKKAMATQPGNQQS
jgi:hypothetical protein